MHGTVNRTLVVVLAACSLAASAARAEPVTVRAGWNGLQLTVSQGEFLPQVTVRTGPDGSGRVKGKLTDVTDAGIALEQRKGQRFIERANVHSVRLVPAKGLRRGWRNVAAVAAFPIGFAALWGGCVLLGGCGETPWHAGEVATTLGMGISVPFVVYRLAWRADRRLGAVTIVLDKDKEKSQ